MQLLKYKLHESLMSSMTRRVHAPEERGGRHVRAGLWYIQ